MLKYLAVFALLLAVALCQDPVTISNSDMSATLDPSAKTLTFWSTSKSSNKYRMSFSQIQEVPSGAGPLNAVNTFSNVPFTVSSPQNETFQGMEVVSSILTGTAHVTGRGNGTSVNVDIRVLLFKHAGELNLGGPSNVEVNTHSMYIVIGLTNWPFVAPTGDEPNVLSLRFRVTTPNNGASKNNREVLFKDGVAMQFADNGAQSIGMSSTSNRVDVTLAFPATTSSYEQAALLTTGVHVSSAAGLKPIFLGLF